MFAQQYVNTKDLETAYLAEIENFLLKISQIKLKINWNRSSEYINNIKKYNKTHK